MTMQTLKSGATLISLTDGPHSRAITRGQNFVLEWIGHPALSQTVESAAEMLVLLPGGAAKIEGPAGDTAIEGPSVVIVPAGCISLRLIEGGPLIVLATDRPALKGDAIEGRTGRNAQIAPIGSPFERRERKQKPVVYAIDELGNPSGNSRTRFVQTETMSINIVRYFGARDTTALSPHAHDDIEQGTLAVLGRYVHHLRTPWSKDMAEWRDDEHVEVGPGTLLLIPPELVHTTQGIGDEPHFLIDIFAPARRDFIAKGWIANAGDYRDPIGDST